MAFVIGALGNVLVLTVLLQRTKKRSFGTFKQPQYNPTKTLLMNGFTLWDHDPCSMTVEFWLTPGIHRPSKFPLFEPQKGELSVIGYFVPFRGFTFTNINLLFYKLENGDCNVSFIFLSRRC